MLFRFGRLDLIEQQGGFHEEVVVILAIFVMDHEQAGGIPGGRPRHQLFGGDGVQPVLEVIGAQVGALDAHIRDDRKFIEGEEVICFLIEFALQVDDVHPVEVDPGAFTEEDIAAAVEGDDIADAIFLEVGQQEFFDPALHRAEFLKGILQSPVVELEIFHERAGAAGAHIDDLFDPGKGMTQFIDFGVDADEIDV